MKSEHNRRTSEELEFYRRVNIYGKEHALYFVESDSQSLCVRESGDMLVFYVRNGATARFKRVFADSYVIKIVVDKARSFLRKHIGDKCERVSIHFEQKDTGCLRTHQRGLICFSRKFVALDEKKAEEVIVAYYYKLCQSIESLRGLSDRRQFRVWARHLLT